LDKNLSPWRKPPATPRERGGKRVAPKAKAKAGKTAKAAKGTR
jgi:hypothetical protein